MPATRPRMLAVVARYQWMHLNYLKALQEHFELLVAWSGEDGAGVVETGEREGLRGVPIGWIPDAGEAEVRSRLGEVLSEWRPDVVHVMYYNHDDLTLIVRELAGDGVTLLYECSDPQTALSAASEDSGVWAREGDALRASDAQIFLSKAMRSYLERSHGLDLAGTSLIRAHGFARETIGPPSPKLSERDGRLHITIAGSAHGSEGNARWFVDIIGELVSLGLVVHSHFYELDDPQLSLEPYRALARELEDYQFHGTVTHRHGTALSDLVSRYDLMGAFYEQTERESDRLNQAVHLPAKSVCGWLHGGIPVVCFAHQRGIAERIEDLGIGFVLETWEDLGRVASDREAIRAATERCLEVRDIFTNEHTAERIRAFLDPLLGERELSPAQTGG